MTKSKDSLHFLLVPDSGAARRMRRELAALSARSGVIVGVWQELLQLAGEVYLCPPLEETWESTLHSALGGIPDAFWSASYAVSPHQTGRVVADAYCQLVAETDPASDFANLPRAKLPTRSGLHVADLVRLHMALSGSLPRELATVRRLLATPGELALRGLRVYRIAGVPRLSRWQAALLAHVHSHCDAAADAALESSLERILQPIFDRQAGEGALGLMQRHLFRLVETPGVLDDSVQWLGVRDFLEEVEVAAGMVQSLLAADPTLRPADIGLLVPERFEYEVALADAFTLAGLPLAGLPKERWHRDLGREAVFHFLYCRHKPSPAMAMASCLSSPLMPWDRARGARLAQAVMEGDWQLEPWEGASPRARAMLTLLRGGDDGPATLVSALARFVDLLEADEALAAQLVRARAASDHLAGLLQPGGDLDWHALRRAVSPEHLASGEAPEFSVEGIALWRESQEPWRAVRHLLVLGFVAGHYPGDCGASSVFSAEDLAILSTRAGLALDTPRARVERSRALFKRQLGCVAESVSFLVPRRDPFGAVLSASESLVFMMHMFGQDEEPILNLDIGDDRRRARYLLERRIPPARAPVIAVGRDLNLGVDLLALRKDEDGLPKPESPSALEKLMVSPLAWLLQRLQAEPQLWAPEDANVLLLGTLSHAVFEQLFADDKSLPARGRIPKLVPKALDSAIREIAPFLLGSAWQVERRLLGNELGRAAMAWHDVLTELGAQVLGSEIWLQGRLGDVAIHGQADALLGLPDRRLLIIDYKKSSASSRRKRMQRGYDCQANLYRVMLQTGGLKGEADSVLAERFRDSAQIGIVYFTLNDAAALADTPLAESASVPGWELIDTDVSSEAMALIGARLQELQQGRLRLNRLGDAEFFDGKAGVKPYALEVTPLTTLFMLGALEGLT